MNFIDMIDACLSNKALLLSVILICGVIFVNGWTDAPNAITASVSTGALKIRQAVIIAAIFNFLGALIMGMTNTSVIESVGNITMMIGTGEHALTVLCAALMSIIIWAVLAWFFGIPTSESHALISGILGAVIACGTNITQSGLYALKLAAYGLFISLPIGSLLGWIFGKIAENIAFNAKSHKKEKIFKTGEVLGAAAMSFMHGAQDSQKFAGVFVAAVIMSGINGKGTDVSNAPIWLVTVCSMIIALGTSVGGYRIIKKVGLDTVSLTPARGFAADLAAVTCMLAASLGGIPVSTTHTATSAVIGAGLAGYPRKINVRSIKEMLTAWILTFPCCGIISFIMVKIFLLFL